MARHKVVLADPGLPHKHERRGTYVQPAEKFASSDKLPVPPHSPARQGIHHHSIGKTLAPRARRPGRVFQKSWTRTVQIRAALSFLANVRIF